MLKKIIKMKVKNEKIFIILFYLKEGIFYTIDNILILILINDNYKIIYC